MKALSIVVTVILIFLSVNSNISIKYESNTDVLFFFSDHVSSFLLACSVNFIDGHTILSSNMFYCIHVMSWTNIFVILDSIGFNSSVFIFIYSLNRI